MPVRSTGNSALITAVEAVEVALSTLPNIPTAIENLQTVNEEAVMELQKIRMANELAIDEEITEVD